VAFISVEFILFICVVVPPYFLVPHRWRIPYLLLSSYLFYSYNHPFYALVLLGSTLADYGIGRSMGQTDNLARRNFLLISSLILNVGLLVIFKYLGFLNNALGTVLGAVGFPYTVGEVSLLMPLGVSFYTFAKIAYIIDVYRKKFAPEQNIITFATFVSFFPNIASGPIERAEHFIPQLKEHIRFEEERVVGGLRLILWGVFKKVVIADRLALYVSSVYDYPQDHQGLTLLVATLFLAFQIYADFSGYTDIARGIARILGINLFENFRQPYLSKSILEFWRRWHISLTTWIREYLFFPLSRYLLKRTKRRHPRLVEISTYLIIMSAVGLWHGANWTFVFWGLLHGIYMSVETFLNARRIQLVPHNWITDILKVVTTFILVSFAWIYFRALSLSDANYIVANLFNFGDDFLPSFSIYGTLSNSYLEQFLISLGLIGLLIFSDWIDAKWGFFKLFNDTPILARFVFYYALIALIFGNLISAQVIQNFVYFQF